MLIDAQSMHVKSDSVILEHLNLSKINCQHYLALSRHDTLAIKSHLQKMDGTHSVANYL